MKYTDKKCKTTIVFLILVMLVVITGTGCGKKIFDDNNKASDISSTIVSWSSKTIGNVGDINFMNENVEASLAKAAALYNITDNKILYSKNINLKLYPASTTKILTAYVALKHGDLKQTLTVSPRCVNLEPGASVCGFKVGDKISLEQALYGLMTCSGNDAGIAIAEGISGSVEAFADLMNQEAAAIGATHSHFCNPHGLHEKDHYTTLNDLYIIFNEAIKNDKFRDLISHKEYTGTVTGLNGDKRELTWTTTNRYFREQAFLPATVTVMGSKTGTTNEAGSCLVLLSKDNYNKEYISIILKTADPGTVYLEMTSMFNTLIKK